MHRSVRLAGILAAFLGLLVSPHARGQVEGAIRLPPAEGEPVDGDVGLELALFSTPGARPGRPLVLSGTAYETRGLGRLGRVAGLEVAARLHVPSSEDASFAVPLGAEVRVRAGSDGAFDLALPIPRPLPPVTYAVVTVSRGALSRGWSFPLAVAPALDVTARADRRRYEPGETVHGWVLVRDPESGAPIEGESVVVSVDAGGARLVERTLVTGASGVVTLDAVLGADASGWHRLDVRRPGAAASDEPLASTGFQVDQRVTARLLATFELDRTWSLPGGSVAGTVAATTASGSPLPRAVVTVTAGETTVASGATDEAGHFAFSMTAPTFLDGESRDESVSVRVAHALGTLDLHDDYVLAQAPWRMEITPEAGALGVDVPSRLLVAVTDPAGEPISAGVSITVRGAGLPPAGARATTDAHGLAAVLATVPATGVALADGGSCSGYLAATYVVEIGTSPPIEATQCVPASRGTELALDVSTLVRAPGEVIELEVHRRPDRAGRDVVLALASDARVLSWARVPARDRRVRLTVPSEARGFLDVVATALADDGAEAEPWEEGRRLTGEEATARVLVRPSDAFALAVTADPAVARIRSAVDVSITAAPAPGRAWAALVVRDEAQHAGELPFAYESLVEDLRAAVRGPLAPADELLVRLALAAPQPSEVRGLAPIVTEPWEDPWSEPWGVGGTLCALDPVEARERATRGVLAEWMSALVSFLRHRDAYSPEARAEVAHGGAFGPRALEVVAELGLAPASEPPRVLGGLALTPAMLGEADPSFSFDTAARLVARWQLVQLLADLHVLTATSDPVALRAIAGQPPSRWLAILVSMGLATAGDLRDPWGRPFAITCGVEPALVFSARAADCALASPGPDGIPGNADDVIDPFARVVPTRTLFALASGEDALMEQLSRIAPGSTALMQMAAAYAELSLAALDETVEAALYAHPSEAVIDDLSALYGLEEREADAIGLGGFGTIGHGSGTGSGSGYGAGYGGLGLRGTGRGGGGIGAGLSAAIREDLPATLFFLGEVPIDASGRAVVPITTADAMSRYHVEAVAWSASGWITSGRTSLRVEQDVEIDAPVPEVLHDGDEALLVLRLRSRALETLQVTVSVETEGPIAAEGPPTIVLPAGEIVTSPLRLRASGTGTGSVLLRATLADGSPLDGIRRRVTVREDARSARLVARTVATGRGTVDFEIPGGALARGPASVRLDGLRSIFAAGSAFPYTAWSSAREGGAPVNDEGWLGVGVRARAYALGAFWASESFDDESAVAVLEALTDVANGGDGGSRGRRGRRSHSDDESETADPAAAASALVGISPALGTAARSEALETSLAEVAEMLRARAAEEGAAATDAPEVWATVAAGLALAGTDEDEARVLEMLRRLEPWIVRVSDLAWVEPSTDDGSIEPRLLPSACVALALEALGRRDEALPFVMTFVLGARGAADWPEPGRTLIRAAALGLGTRGGGATMTLDGAAAPFLDGSLSAGVLAQLAGPGRHTLAFESADVTVLEVSARFGLPWAVVPSRPLRVEVETTGELGARGTRAALVVRVRNTGTRAIQRPTVRVLLPSGAELEEAERQDLARRTGHTPRVEDDELVVEGRPLLPGRSLVFPIRARWSVAGRLRGLGLAVTDAAMPDDPNVAFVVPSRVVEIPEDGEEPELELDDAEVSIEPPLARDVVRAPLVETLPH